MFVHGGPAPCSPLSTPCHMTGSASFERNGNTSQNCAPPATDCKKRRAILRFGAIFFGYAAKTDRRTIRKTPVDDCGRRFPRSILSRQESSRTFSGIAAIFVPCRPFSRQNADGYGGECNRIRRIGVRGDPRRKRRCHDGGNRTIKSLYGGALCSRITLSKSFIQSCELALCNSEKKAKR